MKYFLRKKYKKVGNFMSYALRAREIAEIAEQRAENHACMSYPES